MVETFIGVRDVDEKTFRKFKAIMLEKRIKLGNALTKAMEAYIKQSEALDKPLASNFLKMKTIKVGKKVNWSGGIDETLYGGR